MKKQKKAEKFKVRFGWQPKVASKKLEMAAVLTEHKRFCANFQGSRGVEELKGLSKWEKDVAKNMTEGEIILMGKEQSLERMKRRYGKSCLWKDKPGSRGKKTKEDRILEAIQMQEAAKRTKKVFVKLRRKAQRNNKKPQVYSIRMVLESFPKYLQSTNEGCDLKKTYRARNGRKLSPKQIMEKKRKLSKTVSVW